MENLKELIKKGIIYEDEFILKYMNLIKDQGLLNHFGSRKKQAEELLNRLVKDSTRHKETLEKIISNL